MIKSVRTKSVVMYYARIEDSVFGFTNVPRRHTHLGIRLTHTQMHILKIPRERLEKRLKEFVKVKWQN